MAKAEPSFFALNGGEIDERSQARVDLDGYPSCADVLENVLVSLKGSIAKAPGTQFIAECLEGETVLVRPFHYANVRFHLELADEQMRFITGDGLVVLPGTLAVVGAYSDESSAPPAGGAPPSDGGNSGIGDPLGLDGNPYRPNAPNVGPGGDYA